MNRDELMRQFCDIVNKGLSQGKDLSELAYEELGASISEIPQKSFLDQLYRNYRLAQQPANFFNLRVWEPDERFDQCYELMRVTFGEGELESRERYVEMVRSLKDEHHPYPLVMIGRFWHASGPQLYDASGQLVQFDFNPLAITDNIVSVISGNYMAMQVSQRQGEGIGAIGHLATRDRFRRGQGHGTALLKAFEQEVEMVATMRGERMRLIILEAQADSWWFWAKRGYRWPAGTRYSQPPLDFDPLTGERRFDEVPELLMVKVWDDLAATHVDSKLLMDAVRTIYQNWCLAKTASYSTEAARRARDYVFGKVFAEFVASLPPGGKPVVLREPPAI